MQFYLFILTPFLFDLSDISNAGDSLFSKTKKGKKKKAGSGGGSAKEKSSRSGTVSTTTLFVFLISLQRLM